MRQLTSWVNRLMMCVVRKQLPVSAPSYWDAISDRVSENYFHDDVIGHLKRDAHLRLIARWCDSLRDKVVLKTDLFEEAHGPDQFLFELPIDSRPLGIDISPAIVRRARQRKTLRRAASCPVLAGDVLTLPFRSASLDVIISNSTLDHFENPSYIVTALQEFYRVLKPGGTLLVTLDNPQSVSYLVGCFKRTLRPDPYFLGHTLSIRALTSTLSSIGYRVTDRTAILHGLQNHSSAAMRAAGRIGGTLLQEAIGSVLGVLERFEATPIRYLTGAFVAARAVKPATEGTCVTSALGSPP
jgi:SAM-dependent methyltransferase